MNKKAPVRHTRMDLVEASISDPPLARRMVAEQRDLLTATAGCDENALHWVVIECQVDAVDLLLDVGFDVNCRNGSLQTPLMLACCVGCRDVVGRLIERGADVLATDEFGESALFPAVRGGYVEIVERLLVHGADPNQKNEIGQCLAEDVLPRKREALISLLEAHGYQDPYVEYYGGAGDGE